MPGGRKKRILAGVITGLHGVKGLVVIKSFMQEPEDIAGFGPVQTSDGKPLELEIRGRKKTGLLASIRGVNAREEAEKLKGCELFISRVLLPEAEEESWYYADLVGLKANLPDGSYFGQVAAVQDFGAGDLLEIRPESGASVFLPFTRQVVTEVDVKAGRITIDPPFGLMEEDDDGED